MLGGDRGYWPAAAPDASAAASARRLEAEQTAHRLMLEITQLRQNGVSTLQELAQELTAPRGAYAAAWAVWTHTTVSRLLARADF